VLVVVCLWVLEGVCRTDRASGDHGDGRDSDEGELGGSAAAGEERGGAFPYAALHEREAVLQASETDIQACEPAEVSGDHGAGQEGGGLVAEAAS